MSAPCPRCGAAVDPGRDCARCLLKLVLEGGGEDAPEAPTKLRDLEILGPLGRGGMGQVYKARHPGLNRIVAVKLLPPGVSTAPDFNARFGREAQILAALDHPNIVRVFDYGIDEDRNYLVMEYVEGADLRGLMKERLPREQVLSIAGQVCDALEYAHAQGIVHRDIKPENILVDRQSRVRLVDFGLARAVTTADLRLTQPRQVMGTVHYMAPEQYESLREADHRADIYSLGVVLYEMLSGELPVGKFPPPTRKGAPDARLDDIVLRALEKEPGRRYQRVTDVKADLARAGAPSTSRGRRALVWGAAGLGGILIALAAILRVFSVTPPPDPRDAVVGTWKGTWSSEREARNRGELETVIVKSVADPRSVRLSLTLRGQVPLIGVGDFEVTEEAGRRTLSANRLSVRGQVHEGRWRFTILRSGRRLEGTYTISAPGMTDSGIFDQELRGP